MGGLGFGCLFPLFIVAIVPFVSIVVALGFSSS
jgi:hypothetical protein